MPEYQNVPNMPQMLIENLIQIILGGSDDTMKASKLVELESIATPALFLTAINSLKAKGKILEVGGDK